VDYFGTGHVARCTFSGNSVAGVNAGWRHHNYGALDIVSSTFSGNSSGGSGGGLHVDALSRGTTIRNCVTGKIRQKGAGIYNNGSSPTTRANPISTQSSRAIRPPPRTLRTAASSIPAGHNLFVIAGNIVAGVGPIWAGC
jgi:predicted outer membrane repeat protein